MKTEYMVLTFDDEGGVEALHRDAFDLGFLGKQKIDRASDIRFNETAQLWDIYLPATYGPMTASAENIPKWETAPEASGFATYDVARAAEVAWLEAAALAEVEPLSHAGRWIMHKIRAKMHLEECAATAQNGTATPSSDPTA
jgi:hypothetical protein